MSKFNHTTQVGNVTADPVLRFTGSGKPVANFSIAVNRGWKDGDKWVENTDFFDVVCWERLAENTSQSVCKGTRVIISGRLELKGWETQDGDKRSKVQIVADEVGVSLKWANVEIHKNPREEHTNS
jgi:single-strand DNA-binding protein